MLALWAKNDLSWPGDEVVARSPPGATGGLSSEKEVNHPLLVLITRAASSAESCCGVEVLYGTFSAQTFCDWRRGGGLLK